MSQHRVSVERVSTPRRFMLKHYTELHRTTYWRDDRE